MQNRKLIAGAVALLLSAGNATASASEVQGSRVLGQGAVCGEGEGYVLEFNVSTKQEWSYCYKRDVIITPTQTPSPTPTPTPTPTTTTNSTTQTPVPEPTQNTEPTPTYTQTATSESATVTVNPTPAPSGTPTPKMPSPPQDLGKATVLDFNISTQTTTIREETDEEWYERWIWQWDYWYVQLMKWLNDVWNWSSL